MAVVVGNFHIGREEWEARGVGFVGAVASISLLSVELEVVTTLTRAIDVVMVQRQVSGTRTATTRSKGQASC